MRLRSILATGGLVTLLLVEDTLSQQYTSMIQDSTIDFSIDAPVAGVSLINISGIELKGLATEYFGFKGIVPDSFNVDFKENLDAMWANKFRIAKSNGDVKKFYDTFVKNYDPNTSTKISLEEYLNEALDSINVIKKSIDWNAVMSLKNDEWMKNGEFKKLDSTRTQLVKDMSLSLNQYTVMGNFMTEILSGDNGYENSLIIDFLLRNAGREFIDYIPAKDKWDSKGPSQFTPNAWYDDGITILKASLINYALPEYHRIPKSMNNLTGMDHVKGTYLLNINNLCEFVGSLNTKQFEKLNGNWTEEQVAEFAALAHRHDPNAVNAGLTWINKNMRNNVYDYYNVKRKNHYKDYGKRFLSNFKGLRDYYYLKSTN